MSAYSFNTVIVKGNGIRKEGALASDSTDITPGMFVARSGAKFADVTAAGAKASAKAVAVEQETFGTGITTDYDTDGERVLYHVCSPGDEVFALLATGQNVAVGAALETASGGALTAYTTGPAVALAMEAVNNSAGSAAARILVEIL